MRKRDENKIKALGNVAGDLQLYGPSNVSTTVNGDIKCTGPLTLSEHAKVVGNVTCDDTVTILLSSVSGNIYAPCVVMRSSTVLGDIDCTGLVVLEGENMKLVGNINAKQLSVKVPAIIDGVINVKPDEEVKSDD